MVLLYSNATKKATGLRSKCHGKKLKMLFELELETNEDTLTNVKKTKCMYVKQIKEQIFTFQLVNVSNKFNRLFVRFVKP